MGKSVLSAALYLHSHVGIELSVGDVLHVKISASDTTENLYVLLVLFHYILHLCGSTGRIVLNCNRDGVDHLLGVFLCHYWGADAQHHGSDY